MDNNPGIDYLIALRKIALKNFIQNDLAYTVEKAYRHYSKTYNVPLPETRKIEEHEILMVYFDDQMTDQKLSVEEAIEMLADIEPSTSTPMINPYVPKQQVVSDEEWIAQQEANLVKQEAAMRQKAQDAISKMSKTFNEATKQVNKVHIEPIYDEAYTEAMNTVGVDNTTNHDIKED